MEKNEHGKNKMQPGLWQLWGSMELDQRTLLREAALLCGA